MNLQRLRPKEEPEINLIPMIDALLVIVIFLAISTTYSRYAELQINLPTADAEKQVERANEIHVAVDASGRYVINQTPVPFSGARAQPLERSLDDCARNSVLLPGNIGSGV